VKKFRHTTHFDEFFKNISTLYPRLNHVMWITCKVIVRETWFCEKILTDFTVSWVFQKHFNFVPMLESRKVDHMKSNCSDITVSSVFLNYFNFVPMLESRNMDPLKNNFSCDFFYEKVLAYITVSWNFQNYLNFFPTLQLQLRNVSQLKDNVHETHLFWKYPTYVAVLSFFLIISTFCLC